MKKKPGLTIFIPSEVLLAFTPLQHRTLRDLIRALGRTGKKTQAQAANKTP